MIVRANTGYANSRLRVIPVDEKTVKAGDSFYLLNHLREDYQLRNVTTVESGEKGTIMSQAGV